MTLIELVLVSIALSADAFAAAICQGLAMPHKRLRMSLVTGLYFGGFQAGMPLIGWLLGKQFSHHIASMDHWVAFFLLGIIGINMIKESSKEEDEADFSQSINHKLLVTMAFATSIDALAVGVTFAFLHINILGGIIMIGLITFSLSFMGVLLGATLGAKFERYAKLVGGIALILIGTKILIEHLGGYA